MNRFIKLFALEGGCGRGMGGGQVNRRAPGKEVGSKQGRGVGQGNKESRKGSQDH